MHLKVPVYYLKNYYLKLFLKFHARKKNYYPKNILKKFKKKNIDNISNNFARISPHEINNRRQNEKKIQFSLKNQQ